MIHFREVINTPGQKRLLTGGVCIFAILLILPLILGLGNLFLVSRIMALSIAAMGFNLLWGYTGILSFGHALFYGMGAYMFALVTIKFGVPVLASIAIASVVGGLTAMVVGTFVLRLKGVFLAVAVMAFGQLIWALNLRLKFTGGTDGLAVQPSPLFLSQVNCYYLTLGIFLTTLILLRIIVGSAFGLTLKGIREQALRVEFHGVNVFTYQLASFTISGFFTALSGSIAALLVRGAFPDMFYWTVSGEILVACLIGGIKVFLGPCVGASVYEIVDGVVNRFTVYWPMILGTILILVVLFFREGITGVFMNRAGASGER